MSTESAPTELVGNWKGEIVVAQMRIPVVLHLGAEGEMSLDSPSQKAYGIPVSNLTLKEGSVSFLVRSIAAAYAGNLHDDGNSIVGKWSQTGQSIPLSFARQSESDGITPSESKQATGVGESQRA